MKIIQDYPPNIEALRSAFKLSGQEIFTYGDTVFNPTGLALSPELRAHEEVHIFQQSFTDVERWWERYLAEPEFRLEQELEAHRVEYKTFCDRNKDRNARSIYLIRIATRLASPMYGNIIGVREASRRIRG
jgi:hypothetical protein